MDEVSVLEYIDSIRNVLDELAKEEISYSDYDNMTDWLGEIERHVKKLEGERKPINARTGKYDGWDFYLYSTNIDYIEQPLVVKGYYVILPDSGEMTYILADDPLLKFDEPED